MVPDRSGRRGLPVIPGISPIRGIRGKGSAAPDIPSLLTYGIGECNGGKPWEAGNPRSGDGQDGVLRSEGVADLPGRFGMVAPFSVDDETVLVFPGSELEDRDPLPAGGGGEADLVLRPLREVAGHDDLLRAGHLDPEGDLLQR